MNSCASIRRRGRESRVSGPGRAARQGQLLRRTRSEGLAHDIPTYGRVRYKAVYPGVDMVWYGKQGRLEYDLDLQPGADPEKIAMRFDGAKKLSVEPTAIAG